MLLDNSRNKSLLQEIPLHQPLGVLELSPGRLDTFQQIYSLLVWSMCSAVDQAGPAEDDNRDLNHYTAFPLKTDLF